MNKKKRKPSYIRDELNKLYPEYTWNIFYIHQGNHKSYSFEYLGQVFICKYKEYFIIVFPEKKIQRETENDEGKAEENFILTEKEEEKSKSSSKINELKLKLKESENNNQKNISLIKELELKLKEKDNKLLSLEKKMNEKAEEIDDKKKEIENLKKELKDTNNDKQFMESFYPREQMMALNFLLTDQKVHYAISCVGKDLFVDIEKKFYEKYPKYK